MLSDICEPDPAYVIPKNIKYCIEVFDFDFIDFFIRYEYRKYNNILQLIQDETKVAELFDSFYFNDTGKIMCILLICLMYKNADLFAVISILLYWKWVFHY